MNLTERFFEMTADVREQAALIAARTAKVAPPAMGRIGKLAKQVGKQLMDHQKTMVSGAMHDGAERLRLLRRAESLPAAVRAQVHYLDVTRDRLSRDGKVALQILSKAGAESTALARETYAQMLNTVAAKRPSQARKTVRKVARKTATRARKAA